MPGKCNRTLIPGISVGGAVIPSQADIANTMTSSFSLVCISDNYDSCFRAIKNSAETLRLNFTPRSTEAYSTTFSIDELLAELERCRNTSPDPDGIHNEMLSHLPPAGKEFLLSIYNRIWTDTSVPDAWREATLIPAPKPGKDCSLASSYRPISHTSCLCKTMERLINRRLV
jgi:potassium voltage-gated channel Eag-related subfamily H protein 8